MDSERADGIEATLAAVKSACSEAFDKSERDSAGRSLALAVYQLAECVRDLISDGCQSGNDGDA